MPIFKAETADTSSKAEVGAISPPGRSRGCWTKCAEKAGLPETKMGKIAGQAESSEESV